MILDIPVWSRSSAYGIWIDCIYEQHGCHTSERFGNEKTHQPLGYGSLLQGQTQRFRTVMIKTCCLACCKAFLLSIVNTSGGTFTGTGRS